MFALTSARERRLWIWAAAAVAVVFATLGLAQTLAGALGPGLVAAGFWIGLVLIAAAIVTRGLRVRPGAAEVSVGLGMAGAFLIAALRMTTPEERSHLIEYAVVALLVDAALAERVRNGRRIPVPGLVAFTATALVGALDEAVQAAIPGRTADLRDIGFNTVAAALAIGGRAAVGWVASARRRRRPPPTGAGRS